MGQRSIKAPGVEIIEHDLSGYTTTNLGTGCLITGFAQKGEDLEPIQITNRSAWLLNFGAPTNEAEEYFYNAGMEVLNQGGFLYAAKIPYSNDIAGIYAAAKYTINKNCELYNLDENEGMFYDDSIEKDEEGYWITGIEPNSADGKFIKNYRSLKALGLNTLSLIAPAGQDFISKDLVEEYETGESKPNNNIIYLVDKTRAVYTRATEVADKQENRDSRYCIGIVPVITTMCNTAYFQKKSTGVESDVPELYQPVRSLKTITFPAGAASAADYKPTKLVDDDLHTPLMKKDNTFAISLSEQAATIAQSCLVNGNLVDGKFKPFICNDVCIVVFKAFVSTEDGKIEFTPVETWVGSLDPEGRNEKGLTTFIDTIVNNNSEYIYCFSNLENPEKVLNPDHGFVAGSDSEYDKVKEDLETDREYQAATLFSAYAARMLGFGKDYDDPNSGNIGLAAPRDFANEVLDNLNYTDPAHANYASDIMASLLQFYNADAQLPVCRVDELAFGGTFNAKDLSTWLTPKDNTGKELLETSVIENGIDGSYSVADKFITAEPTVIYRIKKKSNKQGTTDKQDAKGQVKFSWEHDDTFENKWAFEAYDVSVMMGRTHASNEEGPSDEKLNDFVDPDVSQEKLGELSILNSTDYLRAIYDFEQLVDIDRAIEQTGITVPEQDGEYDYDSVKWATIRQQYIQALIINSIKKCGKYKARLRYLKKAKINLDKLDENFVFSQSTSEDKNDLINKKIGEKYIDDLYKSYNDIGALGGITFREVSAQQSSSGSSNSLLATADALEAKLDSIVNIDTTKQEKMNPRMGNTPPPTDENVERINKYVKLKIYLNSQYYQKLAEFLAAIMKIIQDCCYAQQRYVESQRNIDDSNIMLGFYPEMAEPIITYTTIAQSLNKILDTMSNIHESDIDVVCDAGISNIAQFVKQVYDPSADDGEDVGGIYQPVKYSSFFKFNKNTDLAYWKTIVYKFDTFCKFRGDCMFCTDGPRGMVLIGNKQVVRKTKKDTSVDLNILPYLSKIAGFNTSYGAGYLNWYRTISDYTGDTIWIPPSIKAMGTYILTDKQYNWWDAPAGMRRGVINMVETSFNPNRVQAGEIYDVNWNYAIHYLNDGIIQEGQKTFQTRQSALDRVNVRRLIGRIKRYVYFASRQFLYEPHTQSIREKYVKYITPFFQDLVNRGGLYDFKIICDSTNNTPEVIDRNELRVKIGIKPVKTIEFIIIDLCVLNTGASWTEMDAV